MLTSMHNSSSMSRHPWKVVGIEMITDTDVLRWGRKAKIRKVRLLDKRKSPPDTSRMNIIHIVVSNSGLLEVSSPQFMFLVSQSPMWKVYWFFLVGRVVTILWDKDHRSFGLHLIEVGASRSVELVSCRQERSFLPQSKNAVRESSLRGIYNCVIAVSEKCSIATANSSTIQESSRWEWDKVKKPRHKISEWWWIQLKWWILLGDYVLELFNVGVSIWNIYKQYFSLLLIVRYVRLLFHKLLQFCIHWKLLALYDTAIWFQR